MLGPEMLGRGFVHVEKLMPIQDMPRVGWYRLGCLSSFACCPPMSRRAKDL